MRFSEDFGSESLRQLGALARGWVQRPRLVLHAQKRHSPFIIDVSHWRKIGQKGAESRILRVFTRITKIFVAVLAGSMCFAHARYPSRPVAAARVEHQLGNNKRAGNAFESRAMRRVQHGSKLCSPGLSDLRGSRAGPFRRHPRTDAIRSA